MLCHISVLSTDPSSLWKSSIKALKQGDNNISTFCLIVDYQLKLFYYLSSWFSALWWSCCSVFSTYQVKTFPFPLPLSKYKLEIARWTFREFQTYTITDLPRGNNGLSLECNNSLSTVQFKSIQPWISRFQINHCQICWQISKGQISYVVLRLKGKAIRTNKDTTTP